MGIAVAVSLITQHLELKTTQKSSLTPQKNCYIIFSKAELIHSVFLHSDLFQSSLSSAAFITFEGYSIRVCQPLLN